MLISYTVYSVESVQALFELRFDESETINSQGIYETTVVSTIDDISHSPINEPKMR